MQNTFILYIIFYFVEKNTDNLNLMFPVVDKFTTS